MFEIKNFFQKFLNIQNNNSFLIEKTIEVVFDNTGIKLSSVNVELKENSIYINCKPTYKNEILMRLDPINTSLKNIGVYKKIT